MSARLSASASPEPAVAPEAAGAGSCLASHRALYAAFDRFPSAKGAATHIDRAARMLFDHAGGGSLCVLGDPDLPRGQREGRIDIVRDTLTAPHFVDRVAGFERFVARRVAKQAPRLRLAQFRDPWGGRPLLRADRRWACVYELNGLPSIELPERHPLLGPRTIDKLRALEVDCLRRADAIVTPSHGIAERAIALGAPRDRTVVVANGADPAMPPSSWTPSSDGRCDFVYVGAVQGWQGIPVLLRAFARLGDDHDGRLVLVIAVARRQAAHLQAMADALGIAHRCVWHFERPRDEVAGLLAAACASVAPLAPTARNLDQGCCPLKILESMAVGTPVIASDLPCVREIVTHRGDGLLVRPDRPDELARAMRQVIDDPGLRASLGAAARRRIASDFTWDHAHRKMTEVYRALGRSADDDVRLAGTPVSAVAR